MRYKQQFIVTIYTKKACWPSLIRKALNKKAQGDYPLTASWGNLDTATNIEAKVTVKPFKGGTNQ